MAELVAGAIRQKGKPNANFPKDLDISYGELSALLEGKVNGLPSLLKNMKKEKRVDYGAQMLVKDTVVTLVNDYNQGAHFGVVSAEQLREGEGLPVTAAPKKVAQSVKLVAAPKQQGAAKAKANAAQPVKAPAKAPGRLSERAHAAGANDSPAPAPAKTPGKVAWKPPAASPQAKAAAPAPAAAQKKPAQKAVATPAKAGASPAERAAVFVAPGAKPAAKAGKGNFGELLAGAAGKSAFKASAEAVKVGEV